MSNVIDIIKGLSFRRSNQARLLNTLSAIQSEQDVIKMTISQIRHRIETAFKQDATHEVVVSHEEMPNAGFQRHLYSQYGEDGLIEHLFPSVSTGVYVDLGCFHPWLLSNTARLYERGWRGVNVDACTESVEKFKLARPDDVNLNFAIGGDSDGVLELFAFGGADPCNTCDRSNAERIAGLRGIPVPEPARIPVISMEGLIDRYVGDREISVLNVDLETKDLAGLKTGNWTKHRPVLVLVEDGDFLFAAPQVSQIYCYMRSVGYTMYSRCHATSFFVRDEDFGRCQHGGPLEKV